jgi:transcriptional regulator NrdR family protein
MQSKHKNGESIPVGHPDSYKKKNSVPKNIACTQCDQRFSTGSQIEEHMKEHVQNSNLQKEFVMPSQEKAFV